ncbi:MAG: NAD-dependent epimerase/dehydratase family protein [Acidobacteria bacterium]|nr:NAD-dependent epimerase/dehydratase family protein [Acidobacteriota bacterium]
MIFLIGGRGLVGSAFARVCEASGRSFQILDRNTYPNFIGQSCELLINANGNSRKPLAVQQPLADFDASVRSVRASLADFRFERYIHLSSCDVYPDCSSPATTSEKEAPGITMQSPYGFHKYLAEQCVIHACAAQQKSWLIFRLGGFVGQGLKKNAIFDILHGGPLWLDPASELQFLNTEDCARIVLSLPDAGVANDTFNLCGSGTIALRDAIAHTGRQIAVNPGSPLVRYDVAISKLRARLAALALPAIPDTRTTVHSYLDACTSL